jgi:signal transduction histidine kinase
MGTIETDKPKGRARKGDTPSSLRTERSIALIRVTVLAVVTAIYISSIGIRRSLGPGAIVVLTLACIYALVFVLVSATPQGSSLKVRVFTLLVDVGLITLWIEATGGPESEFWTLYLIVIVSVGLRFGPVETLAVTAALALLNTFLQLGGEASDSFPLLYRPTLLILAGFAVGVLAHQRAVQRKERNMATAVAESRAQELGKERAEVARLRQVDLARSEFVAVAAHEFRTPLAAIIGVLSTLRTHGATLQPQVRTELIDGASAQAERLARLVEDLLTVSRIEDGVLRLSMVPIDVRSLISEAARASGTTGRVNVELHRMDPIVCDVDAMIRVLTNLLDNARKYSPEGERIGLDVTQDDGIVRFAVRDSGPGVPEEERDAIFERFRRGEETGKPGAGLGLYISRGLVQAHGGELTVGDAPEGGAEFAFWLPRQTPGELAIPVGPVSAETDDGVKQVTVAAGRSR